MSDLLKSLFLIVSMLLVASVASAQSPAQVQQGEKVYATQRCSICHSIAGKGNAKGPLDHAGTRLSATDIRSWITDADEMTAKTKATRKPFMKSYRTLGKDDVDALVAYMQSLK